MFSQLQNKIPDQAYNLLQKPLDGAVVNIRFADMHFYVNVKCNLGTKMQENKDEIFLPLVVNGFI